MRIGDEVSETDRRWLTKREAAARIQVSKRTIDGYAKAGRVVVRYTVGGHPRVYEPSLWRDWWLATGGSVQWDE